MKNLSSFALFCLLLQGATSAQPLLLTISPDSAPVGTSRTLTATAASPLTLSCMSPGGGSIWSSLHFNDLTRSQVPNTILPLCAFQGTPLAAGQSVFQALPSSPLMSGLVPGSYWLKCQYNVGGPTQTAWVDFHISVPTTPILSSSTQTPPWGSSWIITLSHPTDPSAGYLAVASLGQTNRIVAGSLILSVEQDFLFGLSFPTPHPLLFTGFDIAPLSPTGDATLSINLPPIAPGLILGLHVQAAVIGGSTTLLLTNCIDGVVQ